MVDFLIIYEHKARELDGVCLLKAALELRGYSVELMQAYQLDFLKYRKKRKPKVVLTYCLYSNSSVMRQVISNCGTVHKIVNLQWEQIWSMTNAEAVKDKTPSQDAAKAVHLSWGDYNYTYLINAGVNNAIKTGAIHLDFLKKPLVSIYPLKDELKKRYSLPDGKCILYISDGVEKYPEGRALDVYKNRFSDYESRIDNVLNTKSLTLVWFEQFLKGHKDYYVVYRPHPGVDYHNSKIDELRNNLNNFYVISDGPLKEWILAADFITTCSSTAVVEAFYANKTCLILRPIEKLKTTDSSLFDAANIIDNYNSFVHEVLYPNTIFPIPRECIEIYYGGRDEKFAYKQIIDVLERVINSNAFDIKKFSKDSYFRAYVLNLKKLIKRLVLKFRINEKMFPFGKRLKRMIHYTYYIDNCCKIETASKEEIDAKVSIIKELIMKGKYD